jgi:hypothetical protein
LKSCIVEQNLFPPIDVRHYSISDTPEEILYFKS